LAASRPLDFGELRSELASDHLRMSDLPKALVQTGSAHLQTWYQTQIGDLASAIQYVFSDGLILDAGQLLWHPYLTSVSRFLWPIRRNAPLDRQFEDRYRLAPNRPENAIARELEAVLFGVLLNSNRLHVHEGLQLFFCENNDRSFERSVYPLNRFELGRATDLSHDIRWSLNCGGQYGPQGVTGQARLSLELLSDHHSDLRAADFVIEAETQICRFIDLRKHVERVRQRLTELGIGNETETPLQLDLDIHGHAQIETLRRELNSLLHGEGLPAIRIHPDEIVLSTDDHQLRVRISRDGSCRLSTFAQTPMGNFEFAGIPPALFYLFLSLQSGLGALSTTPVNQLAHKRRGLTRDRDLRLLKHAGAAALIFLDASSFAFGLPVSDGTTPATNEEFMQGLSRRLGALILKGESWPVHSAQLDALCSTQVLDLVKAFSDQIIEHCREGNIEVYLPDGCLKLTGALSGFIHFVRALLLDVTLSSRNPFFEKSKLKSLDPFFVSLTQEVLPSGVNEKGGPGLPRDWNAFRTQSVDSDSQNFSDLPQGAVYFLPESSRSPHGAHLFALAEHGLRVFYDGQAIERFDPQDFRSEFNLIEADSEVITTSHRIDWFELNPKFFFKGVEISADQAIGLSREGVLEFQGRIYRLRSNDMPSLEKLREFWNRIQVGANTDSASNLTNKPGPTSRRKGVAVLQRSQILDLLALRHAGVHVQGGPRWKKICEFYDRLDEPRPLLQIPNSFQAQLKNYQHHAVQWLCDLYELGLGAILADDMGLGKTVTTLAFFEVLRRQGRLGHVLIVVPTSLTLNWTSECQRFTPDLKTIIFQSRQTDRLDTFLDQEPDAVLISTYGLLQENLVWFLKRGWNIVTFDEAQSLKNISAKRTLAARQLKSVFKLCLTGTPLENHFGEFYSLFDLSLPGALGDLSDFRARYIQPVQVRRSELNELKRKTRPCLLRRTKAQVMQELPPKFETTVPLPFEREQGRIYRDIATSYNDQVRNAIAEKGEAKTQLQMLTALLRLRQVCSDPASVPNVHYSQEPPKLSVLLEALASIVDSGESALVFTQFLTTFERIRSGLERLGLKFFEMSGSDSRAVREKRLKGFQDEPGGAVMLMTLKTGGVGLNLTKASYVFHVEPWWNPAVENQATDRAHRIGQNRSVQVYRYIMKESVEEKIEDLKRVKGTRFDALFGSSGITEGVSDPQGGSTSLTQKDFEFLLTTSSVNSNGAPT